MHKTDPYAVRKRILKEMNNELISCPICRNCGEMYDGPLYKWSANLSTSTSTSTSKLSDGKPLDLVDECLTCGWW